MVRNCQEFFRVLAYIEGGQHTKLNFTQKEYRKRNVSGAVYDDPRVAVAAGRFDEVVALAEAQSKCKAIRHGVKSLRESWRTA